MPFLMPAFSATARYVSYRTPSARWPPNDTTVRMAASAWSAASPARAYASCPAPSLFCITAVMAAPEMAMSGRKERRTSDIFHDATNAMTMPARNCARYWIACATFSPMPSCTEMVSPTMRAATSPGRCVSCHAASMRSSAAKYASRMRRACRALDSSDSTLAR